MPFAEPETAGGPYPKDLVGHLLMVWPVDYIDDAPSKFSRPGAQSDVIVVDLVDLDTVDEYTKELGQLSRQAWWRPGRLIGSLKRRLGSKDPVLAWMQMGTASKGMNAPYELVSATSDPASVDRAKLWLEKNPDFEPTNYVETHEQVQARIDRRREQGSNPQPEVETSEQSRVRSQLEQMARQAQAGADRLPDPPQKFPY
jgi:hypothetical protein